MARRRHTPHDQGAALAMVLVLVVILSLWLSAVLVLTESAASAIKTNAERSERRSALVTDALAQVLNQMSYGATGTTRRLGMDEVARTCPPEQVVTATKFGSSEQVRVFCTQIVQSGKVASLASLILTGNSCGSSCVPGQDGGLYVDTNSNGNSCGAASDIRLAFKSGVINYSGATQNVGCASVKFDKNGTLRQPPTPTTCAYSGSNVTCGCPSYGGASWYLSNPDVGANPYVDTATCAQRINESDFSATQSTVDAFIKTTLDSLQPVVSKIKVNAVKATCTLSVASGIIDAAAVQYIKDNLPCSSGNTLFFVGDLTDTRKSGVFRVEDGITLDTSDLKSNQIIGGWLDASGNICDETKAGVQFQMQGSSSSFNVASNNSLIICAPDATKKFIPSVVGKGSSTTFAITMANASTGGIDIEGFVLLPGRPVQLYLNNSRTGMLKAGAILRALKVQSTAAPKLDSNIDDPPKVPGDRVVQLVFKDAAGGDLGAVQVYIRDYFGRRRAYGYEIMGWRTLW